EDFEMVTGTSNQENIDVCWVLDYTGAQLFCVSLNQRGLPGGIVSLDLIDAMQPQAGATPAKKAGKPHFMMVTGTFRSQEVADVLYVMETTSKQMLIVAIPPMNLGTGQFTAPPRRVATFPLKSDALMPRR
ncbi:MAG: hypothetical protein ACRC1K_14670, partial [Planctomycetia bacterium]